MSRRPGSKNRTPEERARDTRATAYAAACAAAKDAAAHMQQTIQTGDPAAIAAATDAFKEIRKLVHTLTPPRAVGTQAGSQKGLRDADSVRIQQERKDGYVPFAYSRPQAVVIDTPIASSSPPPVGGTSEPTSVPGVTPDAPEAPPVAPLQPTVGAGLLLRSNLRRSQPTASPTGVSTEREPNSQPQPPAPPPAPAPAPASIPKIDYAAIRANRLSAFLNAGADRAKRFQVATGAGDDAEREAVHAALVAEAQAEKRNYEEAEAADLTAEREAANQMPGYPTRSFGPPALPHEFLPTAQANFNLGLSDF